MRHLLFSITLLLSFSSSAKLIESIVASVNEEIITLTDIKEYKDRLRSSTMIDDLLINPNEVDDILKSQKKIIELMIREKLLDSEVKKQNLQVTFDRVEKEITRIASQNGLSRDQLVQALQAQGELLSNYQQFIKNRLERHSLIAKTITSKVKISEDDIAAYYFNKKGNKSQNQREVTVAHIFFKKDKNNPNKPLDKARLVLDKLKSGQSFDSLASQYSEDDNFNEGGLLGTFKPGDLVGILDQEIQTLKVGENSKVVPTKRGYHILKVTQQKFIPDPEFEKEKPRIRGILYQQAFKKQFDFWIEQKRREAFIRINKV